MDHFYKNLARTVEIQDIHSTGVTCMFIASKYEEIYPIRIKTMQNKIAHNKINASQIKEKETEIFETLSFHLSFPTLFEFLMAYREVLGVKEITQKFNY